MIVYRMIPKQLNFLEKPDMVKIEEHEGDQLRTFKLTVNYYKEGKQYIIIDPNIGLPITRFIGNKKALRSYVESHIPQYIQTIKDNREKIVRIHRTYEKALNKHNQINELKRASNFNPLVEFAKKGSGFHNGKQRIFNAFLKFENKDERIKFLKKEYSQGGFGYPRKTQDKFELCGSWHDASVIALEWYVPYQDEKEYQAYNYSQLESEIDKLIKQGNYV